MSKVPKYIMKDIAQISRYAEKMTSLIREVEDWWDKQLEKNEDIVDEIPYDEFTCISFTGDLKEFDLDAIIENLELIESYLQ